LADDHLPHLGLVSSGSSLVDEVDLRS
jgi:hypothetical protein